MESAPESTSADDRSRLRRRAVIEFEIERTPEAPDRVVASACRTTSRAVAAVRDEMTCDSPVPELDAAQAV